MTVPLPLPLTAYRAVLSLCSTGFGTMDCCLIPTSLLLHTLAHQNICSILHGRLWTGSSIRTLDSTLSLDPHINNIVKNCNYHLQALWHIPPSITKEVANTMACAIIGSQLDYCNSMFYKMSDKNFNKLQRIQNRAARIVRGVGQRQ